MSSASNYLEEQIGTHLLRTGSWTKPAAIYVALFTAMPGEDGTGATEVSGGSYARVACGPGDAFWNAPTGGNGEYSNAGVIAFPAPSADWGTVVGMGLFDAASGGNLLILKTLDTSRVIANGDAAPNFPIGSLKVTIA